MIGDYFQSLMTILTTSRIIRSHQVEFDKRDLHIGYVRGNVYFMDGSLLHLREFVNTEAGVERFSYAYPCSRNPPQILWGEFHLTPIASRCKISV